MKIKCFIKVFLILFIACVATVTAQKIEKPSQGKVKVYFLRTSSLGALINFKFFDGEKFLGKFNGKNYMVYECEPGEHIIWAAAENRDFVEADFEEGQTYLLEVEPRMGAFKAAVRLNPITSFDPKSMKKIIKLVSKKDPKTFDENELTTEQQELDFFIKNGLEKYNTDKKKGKEFTTLRNEMSYEKTEI